jgi:hypothetical protein
MYSVDFIMIPRASEHVPLFTSVSGFLNYHRANEALEALFWVLLG